MSGGGGGEQERERQIVHACMQNTNLDKTKSAQTWERSEKPLICTGHTGIFRIGNTVIFPTGRTVISDTNWLDTGSARNENKLKAEREGLSGIPLHTNT